MYVCMHLETFAVIWCHQEASALIWRHPPDTQEAPRRHPGGTQGAPRRHPGGTQEAPRSHPEAPWTPERVLRQNVPKPFSFTVKSGASDRFAWTGAT